MEKEKKENICEMKIFENGNEMREHCGKGKWKWRRRSRAPNFSQRGKEMLLLPVIEGGCNYRAIFCPDAPFFCFFLSCVAAAPRLMRRAVRSDYLTDVRCKDAPGVSEVDRHLLCRQKKAQKL